MTSSRLARLIFKCFNIIFSLKDWIGNVILKHSCMDVTWMVLAKDGLVVFYPSLGGYTGGNVSDIGCIWGDLYGYSNGDNMINM